MAIPCCACELAAISWRSPTFSNFDAIYQRFLRWRVTKTYFDVPLKGVLSKTWRWLLASRLQKSLQKRQSRPQSPRSFWSAPGIETAGRKSAIHELIGKSDKSDWLKNTERVLCACSEIGSGQRSRSPAQTRRIAASGDENEKREKALKETRKLGGRQPRSQGLSLPAPKSERRERPWERGWVVVGIEILY